MFSKIVFAVVSVASVFAVPASAASIFADGGVRTVTISYADLNLAAPAGQNALAGRIRRAAASVCGSTSRQLDMSAAVTSCRTAAIGGASARMAVIVASNDYRGGTMQVAAR